MKTARLAFSVAVLVLLACGYLASQYYWFAGEPQRWAAMVDVPPVVWASFLILLAAVVLSFLKEKG